MKLVAIMGGGDWVDASIQHILVNDDVDLEAEKVVRETWYQKEYLPALRVKQNPIYYSFVEWLINRQLARLATENEITEFWS